VLISFPGTSDAVHPEDLPRVLELNKRGLASGLPFNFELRLPASTANIGGLTPAASQFVMTPGASRVGTIY
jgi:hypothetical protein